MSSVYVVCWIFLQTFQTYFCIQANSVDPDQTAPKGAVWSGSTLFAKMTFKITSRWQSRLFLIVVIGALRVKYSIFANIFAEKMCKSYPHFFSKNTCELDIVLTRTVTILTTNKLVKLTMLWRTGPKFTVLDTSGFLFFTSLSTLNPEVCK